MQSRKITVEQNIRCRLIFSQGGLPTTNFIRGELFKRNGKKLCPSADENQDDAEAAFGAEACNSIDEQ